MSTPGLSLQNFNDVNVNLAYIENAFQIRFYVELLFLDILFRSCRTISLAISSKYPKMSKYSID